MLVGAGLLLPVKQSRALPVVGKVEDGSREGGRLQGLFLFLVEQRMEKRLGGQQRS